MSYTNPELKTINDNEEQIRKIVQEENAKSGKSCCCYCCTIYWLFQITVILVFLIIYFGKNS